MKSIGQLVQDARTAAKLEGPKFAKSIKISKSMLNQLEHNRPVVITDETLTKLQKGGIKIPAQQLEDHNYIARACAKAKDWSAEFRAKLAKGALPLSPELQAASDAVDKELAEKGTVGGIPVDTSKMVKPKLAAVAKKAAKPAKKVAAAKPVKKQQPATSQGFLPGFLGQMSNARIEEMVVEMIYKRLQERIDAKVDEIFGSLKQG